MHWFLVRPVGHNTFRVSWYFVELWSSSVFRSSLELHSEQWLLPVWAGVQRSTVRPIKWNLIGGHSLAAQKSVLFCFVAKLWYVLQMICCARGQFQKFHRVFATFVWGSAWEPMRRDSLFRFSDTVRFGLILLFLKQFVARFLFFWTASHYFPLTYLQTKLTEALPYLVISGHIASIRLPRTGSYCDWVFENSVFVGISI